MNLLSWISDENLHSSVDNLINRANTAVNEAEERIQKNVIDPFSSLLIATTFKINSKESLISTQKRSSALKGMSNALGLFHQEILASIQGWENHDAGFDILNNDKKILAEVKNKHNTMNASNRKEVESYLDVAVQQRKGWTGYLVVVIPKKPIRYKKRLKKRPVFEIDGVSFYEEATGVRNALHDLFEILCNKTAGANLPADVREYCMDILDKSIPAKE